MIHLGNIGNKEHKEPPAANIASTIAYTKLRKNYKHSTYKQYRIIFYTFYKHKAARRAALFDIIYNIFIYAANASGSSPST